MCSHSRHVVYLSLGSNLGQRHLTIQRAIQLIALQVGIVDRQSTPIETEPWGFSSSHRFLNLCLRVLTTLSPHEVLHATQAIERQLGRTQKSTDGHYHDRPIDIDILLYDDVHISTPQLTLPHPLMHERDFVMIPLCEIMR